MKKVRQKGAFALVPLPGGGVMLAVSIPPPPPVPPGYEFVAYDSWTATSAVPEPFGGPMGQVQGVAEWLRVVSEWGPLSCVAREVGGTAEVGTSYNLTRKRWDPWRDRIRPTGSSEVRAGRAVLFDSAN